MRFRLNSGNSLRYETRGRGRVVVLLHPVGLRAEFWDSVISELESDFRLIAVDARGHGDSDAARANFEIDDMAGDVIELIRTLGAPPCFVAGCSMGGMTAQSVAILAPELIAGVISANAPHVLPDEGRAAMKGRAEMALEGMPAILETTLNRWFDDDVQKAKPDIVEKARDWLLQADPVMHAWSWLAIRNLDNAGRLAKLKMPALAIAGIGDRATAPAAVQKMAADIPNCRYVEIESGHLAPLEKPVEFAAAIRTFANENL